MTVVNMPSPGTRRRKPKPMEGEQTELDIAERLVERYGSEVRYCAQLGGWHTWTGTHWVQDEVEQSRELVKNIARALAGEAATRLDQNLFKAAKRAGSAGGVEAILNLARSTPGLVFLPDDANRDPYALNVANGVVDLRSGDLRAHDRSDLITRTCPVAYDPSAQAPTFHRFLDEVQPDQEVRRYLARLFGYAATGVVREHVLSVLWGPGANGKSVLADVVTFVLGAYARPGPASLIVQTGNHEPHPTDVASCVGSRLVIVHETKRGAGFDASKVKLLTGGDRLTARQMRQDFFTFAPTHKLVMLSNYKPRADASDAALWRRVQLVPFDVVIPEERRDAQLADAIRAEAPGVLRWIVEGAREWATIGLAAPAVVREQTESYRASEDVVASFLSENTIKTPPATVKAGVLYASYKRWCEDGGQRAVSANEFGAELVARGYQRVERASGRLYLGIGLRAVSDDRRSGDE